MVRSRSGSSPLDWACNTTLFYYSPPDYFPTISEVFNDKSINVLQMHPVARAVASVCAVYLCRVAEVLSLSINNVVYPDRCLCPGSKRGYSYIIYLPGLSSQISRAGISDQSCLLFPISYIKCYRSFLRAGIRAVRSGFVNSARCHAPRYQVNNFVGHGIPPENLGDLLHHKSKSSILYYLNEMEFTYGKDS